MNNNIETFDTTEELEKTITRYTVQTFFGIVNPKKIDVIRKYDLRDLNIITKSCDYFKTEEKKVFETLQECEKYVAVMNHATKTHYFKRKSDITGNKIDVVSGTAIVLEYYDRFKKKWYPIKCLAIGEPFFTFADFKVNSINGLGTHN